MSIRQNTPCDCDGICPYDAQYNHDCEYWCGADESEDNPDEDYLEPFDDHEERYEDYLD